MSLSLQNGAPEPHFAVGAMTSDLCGLLGHGTVRADQNFVPLGKIFCLLDHEVSMSVVVTPLVVVTVARPRDLVPISFIGILGIPL